METHNSVLPDNLAARIENYPGSYLEIHQTQRTFMAWAKFGQHVIASKMATRTAGVPTKKDHVPTKVPREVPREVPTKVKKGSAH